MAFSVDLGWLRVHMGLDAKSFEAGLKRAEMRMRQMGETMQRVGRSLTMKVTAPIVALGTLATRTSIQLETAWIGVQKTVEATAAEYAVLRSEFDALAMRMPLQIEQLFGIGEAAGQLGIAKENIIDFSETMAQLGATTNLSAQQAATSLARFANITQMSQENFDRLGSVVVDLGNNMATTEAEIVTMSVRLAATGKLAGLTEAGILSLAGALSSVGVQAQVGGTAMQKVLKNMIRAVADGGEQLEIFAAVAGKTSEQFAKAFGEDAESALADFMEGLGTAGSDAFVILEGLSLADERLTTAVLSLANAGTLLRESFERGNKASKENTALTIEFEKRAASAASQLQTFWNEVRLTADSFKHALIPALIDVIDKLRPMLQWIRDLDEGTKSFALKMAVLAASMGPTIFVIGKMTTGLVAMGVALAANVTLAGALIGVLTVGVGAFMFGKHLSEQFEVVQATAIKTLGIFREVWAGIKFAFKGMIASMRAAWQTFFKWILNTVGDIVWKAALLLQDLEDATGKALGAGPLAKKANQLFMDAQVIFPTEALKKNIEEYAAELERIRAVTATALEDVAEEFREAAKEQKKLQATLSEPDAFVNTIEIEKATRDLDALVAKLKEAGEAVPESTDMEELLAGFQRLGTEGATAWDSLTTHIQNAADGVRGFGQVAIHAFDGAADALTDFLLTGEADFKAFVDSAIRDITRMIIRMQFARALGGIFPGLLPVPAMAAGGVVTRPTLVMAGEAGPEAIVPLNKAGMMNPPNVVINNQTGAPFEATQPEFDGTDWVVGIVTKDIRDDGPMSQALRGG